MHVNCTVREIVFISNVIIRKTPYMAKRCHELNIVLKGLCIACGYNFIENYDIKYEDLASDDVHLNEPGNIKLANNLLNALNGL